MSDFPSEARSHRSDILFTFAVLIALLVAWRIRVVLLILFECALFAVILKPVVDSVADARVGRWHPFRKIAVPVILLAALSAAVSFGQLALPPVIYDLQRFSKDAPNRLPALMQNLRSIPFADRVNPGQLSAALQDFAGGAASFLLVSVRGWAGGLLNIATSIILTVYFILDGKNAYRYLLTLIPRGSRQRLDNTLQRARVRMSRWLFGQGTLMLILGVASTIVFVSLHVRYAYALGAFSGLMNIIPIIGPAISITLALLVAVIDSWSRVLGVAIFYTIYQQVENAYLTPRIMKSSVGLPGLAVLIALMLGSSLAGVLGAMISVPTAVLVTQLVDEYLVDRDETGSDGWQGDDAGKPAVD